MPRAFSRYNPRLRSPFASMSCSPIQRIHQGGQAIFGFVPRPVRRGQVREHGRDAPDLKEVDHAHERGMDLDGRAAKGRDRIDDDRGGREALDLAQHQGQVHLEAVEARPRRLEAQQAGIDVPAEIEADRAHVAHDLGRGFLEGEVDAAFAAPARRIREMRGEDGLAGAGRARDEHARSAIIAADAEHGVDAGDAARHDRSWTCRDRGPPR